MQSSKQCITITTYEKPKDKIMDLNEIMQQAKEIQSRVSAVQDELANVHVKGLAGNGACIVELTGKYDIVNIMLSDDALTLSANDLSQIIKNAFQDAKNKADDVINQKMSDATQGMDLPL